MWRKRQEIAVLQLNSDGSTPEKLFLKQSYTAKLSGTDAPYKGDPNTNVVALKRIDKNTIEETDKLDGKVVSVTRMAIGSDGKSETVSVQDSQNGTTNQFTLRKQYSCPAGGPFFSPALHQSTYSASVKVLFR